MEKPVEMCWDKFDKKIDPNRGGNSSPHYAETEQRKNEIKLVVSKINDVDMQGYQIEVSSKYIAASTVLVIFND